AANRLAVGDLSARSGTMHGALELIQLGRALDKMAESVQERTTELVETNEPCDMRLPSGSGLRKRSRNSSKRSRSWRNSFSAPSGWRALEHSRAGLHMT